MFAVIPPMTRTFRCENETAEDIRHNQTFLFHHHLLIKRRIFLECFKIAISRFVEADKANFLFHVTRRKTAGKEIKKNILVPSESFF